METSTNNQQAQQATLIETKVRLENRLKGNANNFFWIGGLSFLNSASAMMGFSWQFFIGLGITQVVDGASIGLAGHFRGLSGITIQIIAFLIDIAIACVFFAFGYFARKGHKWSFIIGMVLYGLDGLIFLFVRDFLSFAFHLFILWGLYQGLVTLKKMEKIQLGDVLADSPLVSAELQTAKRTNRVLFIVLLLVLLAPFLIFMVMLIPQLK